jgi:hypothetical protein
MVVMAIFYSKKVRANHFGYSLGVKKWKIRFFLKYVAPIIFTLFVLKFRTNMDRFRFRLMDSKLFQFVREVYSKFTQ